MRINIKSIIAYGSATIFVSSALGIATLVVGDIVAGALHGEPETGWGFLLAMFILPITIVSFIIFLASSKVDPRVMQSGQKYTARWKILLVAFLLSLVLSGLTELRTSIADRHEEPPYNAHDTLLRNDLSISIKAISAYYRTNNSLPDESVIHIPSEVRYTIARTDTVKLCGDFQDSTVKYYYDPKYPAANGGDAARVVEGKPIGITNSGFAFTTHRSGEQCYLVMMHN